MSRDLEEQVNEMGPAYRAVVARLCASGVAEDFRRETSDAGRWGFMSKVFRLKSYLTAASLLVLVGLGVLFLRTSDVRRETRAAGAACPREYAMTVDEMIATQNPDGSWKNDFLTRRNAETLKLSGDPAAQVAYKKAMRNLRVRGVL